MRFDARLRALLLATLALPPAIACGGDRAPAVADSAAAATATAGSVTYGGDTAIAAGGAPAATGTAVAPATGTAAGTVPTGRPVPVDSPAAPATATATATATPAAPVTPVRDTTPPSSGAAVAAQPPAPAPTPEPTPPPAPAPRGRAAVPFHPGESVEYDVKFGSVDVGNATMRVVGLASVRGHETYHVSFNVRGGTLFYKVNDRYESWMDTRSLVSHRHKQQIDEGSYERERTFEIFVERGVYREDQKPEQKTVDEPLDDGSFFFFVRTLPLEVGKTYHFDRYFRPDRNPVTIKVLRKERVKVPAGTYDATVIQPLIKTKGIFGEGGRAEIWLADDSTRAMLQMKSKLKFGSLNLYMKRYRAGTRPQ